jgi:hypothetical protein
VRERFVPAEGRRRQPSLEAVVAVNETQQWTGRRIAVLVIGAVLGLFALALLGGGGTALWADRTQRDAGYVTTGVHKFSTAGGALATVHTHLGGAGTGWLYAPGLMGKVRIRVTPTNESTRLFVGIARSADVDRYLAGVNHTVISEFWGERVEHVGGGPARSAPGAQHFWVASSTGSGRQTVVWKPADGDWTVVVMNADGRRAVDIGADLGVRFPALPWIALGVLVSGAVFLAGGALLIVSVIRRRPSLVGATSASTERRVQR